MTILERGLIKDDMLFYLNFLEKDSGEIFPLRDIFCKAIAQIINEDPAIIKIPQTLKIGKGFKIKEIVKIVRKLKLINALDNTFEEIALVISTIFDKNYSTILQYLKDESHTENSNDILNS